MTASLAQSKLNLLLNESRRLEVMNDLMLRRFVFERFLYRLGHSQYGNAFVLKGAMALVAVTGNFKRPTRDMDMLGLDDLTTEEVLEAIKEIGQLEPPEPDAIRFDVENFTVDIINARMEEPGACVTGFAYLGQARVPLKIEVSHGHLVTPEPVILEYPTVIPGSAPAYILAYPKETILAEKFEAICSLGTRITRFKDFYDVRELARKVRFDGELAAKAVARTFAQRGTELPQDVPASFEPEFSPSGEKGWKGFLRKQGLLQDQSFSEMIEEITPFVMEIASIARGDVPGRMWAPDLGWQETVVGLDGPSR